MNYSTLDVLIILVLLVVTNGITGLVVHSSVDKNWQKQCNERGHSGYNEVSGKWEWKSASNSAKVTVVESQEAQPPLLPPSGPSSKQ